MSTRDSLSEQTMAELGCENLGAAPRVLIGGLGFGFTLRRVLELCPPNARVEVAELLPVVIEWNRQYLAQVNGQLLDDARVHVKITDVATCLGGQAGARYHGILLDVDNSPKPFVQQDNASLYDAAGLAQTRESLWPGGRVVYWSAVPDRRFARALGQVFDQVQCVPAKAYPQAKKFTHTLFVADRH